ncbi:MAG TPA: DJ-1/PfpI family protein [Kofleriaceae bacterium]|nr:DJ-1/PfpI family protein [Kofleriaceae bacterium]
MSRVLVIVFDGVQTLDATGPAEVFAAAGRIRGRPMYDMVYASIGGSRLVTSSDLTIHTRDLRNIKPTATDTVVVAGGDDAPVIAACADRALLAWIRRAAPIVERMTSVCSGAFVLAAAGLLDGKRATTHWIACERLAKLFPNVTVDGNAIFIRDGAVWTSAGVTTGIDMALAMVEDDHGRELADAVAARLVLYVRRPGFQSQFSDALVAQTAKSDPLGPAITWARAHLDDVDVEAFAKHAGLSVRTLHRRCLDTLATTPAKLLDRLRVEHARTLLTTSDLAVKTLAARCGFGNAVRMKRAFERELGIGPREYRVMHA